MNLLRNPNIIRASLPLALIAALAGSTACDSFRHGGDTPAATATPTPESSEDSAPPDPPMPSCTVSATNLHGRTESFNVATDFEPSSYAVDSVTYDFGDGTSHELGKRYGEEHTYTSDGTFVVKAYVNAEPTSNQVPPLRGGKIDCAWATIVLS